MIKRILTVLVSLSMLFAMVPAAYAESAGDASNDASNSVSYDGKALSALAARLQDPENDPFRSTEGDSAVKAAEDFPESYDLRDYNCVTPVKFQNPFGTCWGFAAIAAAESSLLGSGLAAKDGYDVNTLDLSEKHLVYFVSEAINDPSSPQFGEGTHCDEGVTIADKLNGGGFSFMATSLFASGTGPIIEDRDPLLYYSGLNKWTIKRSSDGKVRDYCYDDKDDWSLPEEMRFRQSYVLKESFILDSPAQVNYETEEYTYNPEGTSQIKEMLMSKRAVQIGFCADTFNPSQEPGDGKYISRNWAHYTYDATGYANHAVTIVGWDDNYDKSNFIEGHQPPANGAWLIKNSWGSQERSFPDRGPGWGIENSKGQHTGYFWLSYYDKTLCTPEALDFDKSNVGSAYNLDEHDFMPVDDISGASVPDKIRMSNVFEADECELLEQVSCETTFANTKVINEVYLLPDEFSDPTDGKLVDRTETAFRLGGFHKIDLASPDIIQKGQHYSIVQTQITPEGEYAFNFPIAMNKEAYKVYGFDSGIWVEGVINKGESFLYADGHWFDYSDSKLREKLLDISNLLFSFDNFPIKGYSTPLPNISMRISGDTEIGHAEGDNSSTLKLLFAGDSGDDFDTPKISWELAEGGSDIFTLTPDPKEPTKVTVTSKGIGRALMYVTAEGIGTIAVPLSVEKKTISAVSVFIDDGIVYDGKAHKPKFEVEDDMEEIIPASHYTYKYRKNVKCGDAEIIIKIKPGDPVYSGSEKVYFSIIPKKSVIRSLSTGSGKMTVKVKSQKASGVVKYKVKYRAKGSKKWSSKSFKAKSGTKLVIKGLRKGRRYQVKVCAVASNDQNGEYSKTVVSGKVK